MKKIVLISLIGLSLLGIIGGYTYQKYIIPVEDLVYGDETAPIKIVNYTSFQCPPCANFHETYGEVLEKYMDSGDIKLVVKAVDLDKFEYDEVIYQHLTEEYLTDYRELSQIYDKQEQWYALETEEEVIELLGLNDTIDKDLKRQIKENSKDRVKLGIKGVPTTFINGVELELGLSVEVFEEQIINLLQ